MHVFQGRASESVLYLSLSGTPATGILYNQVTVKIRRAGEFALTAKVLVSADWVEIGSGFYALQWAPADVSNIGRFLFTMTSVYFDNFTYGEFDVDPVPFPFSIPPSICLVSGNIVDLGGEPSKGNQITAHAPAFPVGAGGSIVSSDFLRTTPDFQGNWQLPLIQGKTVIVELDRTGARYQIVVPNQSTANFLDLVPPLPN